MAADVIDGSLKNPAMAAQLARGPALFRGSPRLLLGELLGRRQFALLLCLAFCHLAIGVFFRGLEKGTLHFVDAAPIRRSPFPCLSETRPAK